MLADGDPELRRAIEAALRPWRIEVVVAPAAPADPDAARARADDQAARYVVWRDGAALVVYDRQSGQEERREARAGTFDPLAAAAAALTVKTMLRLPPLPPAEVVAPAPPPTPPPATTPPAGGIELRLEAGSGPRYEQGLDGSFALRFAVAASVRPWRDRGWRFGLLGDFGASGTVDQAGFHGTWTNGAVLATGSWALSRGPWELGLWAGAGVELAALDGYVMTTPDHHHAALLALRGGPTARYHLGRFVVGLLTAVETLPTTHTYTRPPPSSAQIFEIPPFGIVAEAVVGVDLTP